MSERGLTPEQLELADYFLKPFDTPQEMRDWMLAFFNIDFPDGFVDDDSNSSPVDWMFEAYTSVRYNKGETAPVWIVYSSRDSYKTLSCSAFEVIVMIHFNVTVAHMAAIKSQSAKAIQYINNFVRLCKPYFDHHGFKLTSQSKSKVEMTDKDGNSTYMTVIVCTLQGANCISPDSVVHYWDGSTKPAKQVQVGDQLKTWDYTTQKFIPVSVGTVSYTQKQAQEIIFRDGSNLVLSSDHQVFTQRGWIPAGRVRIGDRMTDFGGAKIATQYQYKEDCTTKRSLEQLMYGTLLGDSSLYFTTNRVRFQVSHCKDQRPYLDLHYSLLVEGGFDTTIYTDSNNQFKLMTKTHDYFEEVSKTTHHNKKKKVTQAWLDKLTWEGIAYWFMDDARGNGKQVGLRKDHRFELAVCGFSVEECALIQQYFTNKGFTCWYPERKYRILTFDLESSRTLSDLIEPYFITSMRYKLLPSKDLDFTRCIKTGTIMQGINRNGFRSTIPLDSRGNRRWRKDIKANLTQEVVEIKYIGMQDLIDLHIDTNNEHHKSFLCNSMKLIHNSEHTNLMVVDEVDVVQYPQAFEEAKMIPGVLHGRFPMTVMTSTRKFAFGLMQKEITKAQELGRPIKHWNLIDITEKCLPERHKPDEDKQVRYINKSLPLRQISEEQYQKVPVEDQPRWDKIEAYSGCASCKILPVCRMRLAHRRDTDIGGLYKPIPFTMNQFDTIEPDMAEAQLMCWKPSAAGLVYGRFDQSEGANTLSLEAAWYNYTGSEPFEGLTLDHLIDEMHRNGVKFYVGGDWGFRHLFALIAGAILPSGEFWIFETFGMSGLEFDDMMKYSKMMRDKYLPKKWYMDTAQPMFIKSFKKNRMSCQKFTKDVMGGIESIRKMVVDSSNRRRLKVIKSPENKILIDGFHHHHFKTDAAGNITQDPDDEEFADVMDSLRYLGQNLFGLKKTTKNASGAEAMTNYERDLLHQKFQASRQSLEAYNRKTLQEHARTLTGGDLMDSSGSSGSGGVIWDFSDDLDET